MKTFEVNGKEYPVEIMEKFIDVLRSGKYEQGVGELQTDKCKFCCLGVGCMEFTPKNKRVVRGNGFLLGELPSIKYQPNAPKWLMDIDKDFYDKTGRGLANLNDTTHSHPEIADLLQAVYIEKVLE